MTKFNQLEYRLIPFYLNANGNMRLVLALVAAATSLSSTPYAWARRSSTYFT